MVGSTARRGRRGSEIFVGLGLTDPYSRTPRAIDIALVTEDGEVQFELLPWPAGAPPRFAELADEIARRFPRSDHFLVIDGPQTLAAPGNNRRQCEALTRTPARTPDALPDADGRPFAGYVRGSILLWRELMRSGWIVAEELDQIQPGHMAEAFPGDAWRRLSPHRLPSKATAPGRAARLALLRKFGLRLPRNPLPTHDQLDAAICAALGYWSRNGGQTVELVGEPLRQEGDELREGYILSPTALPRQPWRTQLVGGDVWVYFATDAQADQASTFEIIEKEHVLWRPALDARGQAIANLRRVLPGDAMVLVHGGSMLGGFLGTADGVNLHPFGNFPLCVAEVPMGRALRERFLAAGYEQREPVTVLVLEDVRALPDGLEVPVQRGQNAIHRVARPDLLDALQERR